MKLIGIYKTRATASRVATMRERKHYEATGFDDLCEIRPTADGYAVYGY